MLREVVFADLLSAVLSCLPTTRPTGSPHEPAPPAAQGLCSGTRLPHRPLSIFNSTMSGLLQSKLPLMVTRQTISSVCMSSKGRTAASPFQFRDASTDCMEADGCAMLIPSSSMLVKCIFLRSNLAWNSSGPILPARRALRQLWGSG